MDDLELEDDFDEFYIDDEDYEEEPDETEELNFDR